MDPIAIYRDRGPGGMRRELRLFPDKVHVRGKSNWQSEFETHVPLATLEHEIGVITWRGRNFAKATGCFLGSIIVLAWTIVKMQQPVASLSGLIASSFVLASLAFVIWSFPKYKAYRFINTSSIVVLDVIEAGPEKDRAADFAQAVSNAVKSAGRPLPVDGWVCEV